MKGLLALLALSVLAATAGAQTIGERWFNGDSAWSINIQSSDWVQGEGFKAERLALLAVPRFAPPQNEVRMCFAVERVELSAYTDAAEVRTRAGDFEVSDIAQLLPHLDTGSAQLEHAVVDGVAVADVTGVAGQDVMRARVFVTPVGSHAMMVVLACVSSPALSATQTAEVDAILTSLRIHDTSEHT